MSDGFPIVLTADRTLTADYRLLFDGMLAASQTTTAPPAIFGPLLMPHRSRSGVRATVAPLGLRRIEAALLAGGFSPDEVAVVNEDQLGSAIGRATRVIGISSGEPAGLGMNTSTMTAIAGGTDLSRGHVPPIAAQDPSAQPRWLGEDRLGRAGRLADCGRSVRRARQLGIDHVIAGYAEANAAAIVPRPDAAGARARSRVGRLGSRGPDSADPRGKHDGRGRDQPRMRARLLVLHDRRACPWSICRRRRFWPTFGPTWPPAFPASPCSARISFATAPTA